MKHKILSLVLKKNLIFLKLKSSNKRFKIKKLLFFITYFNNEKLRNAF